MMSIIDYDYTNQNGYNAIKGREKERRRGREVDREEEGGRDRKRKREKKRDCMYVIYVCSCMWKTNESLGCPSIGVIHVFSLGVYHWPRICLASNVSG